MEFEETEEKQDILWRLIIKGKGTEKKLIWLDKKGIDVSGWRLKFLEV
jgi:hypothetical protein